jgi:CHASE2 domain-containing sensor protein
MMMVCQADSSIVRMLLDFWTAALILLAAAGVVLLWRRDHALALLLALTILYFLGISAGGESEARFRVPVTPQLAIAAGVALEALWAARRQTVQASE